MPKKYVRNIQLLYSDEIYVMQFPNKAVTTVIKEFNNKINEYLTLNYYKDPKLENIITIYTNKDKSKQLMATISYNTTINLKEEDNIIEFS